MKISIINGPNLNLLGKRETDIYGSTSFDDFFKNIVSNFPDVDFDYYQSNVEGELINQIQDVGDSSDGIILNAAAFTHTSVGIADAVKFIKSKGKSAALLAIKDENTIIKLRRLNINLEIKEKFPNFENEIKSKTYSVDEVQK